METGVKHIALGISAVTAYGNFKELIKENLKWWGGNGDKLEILFQVGSSIPVFPLALLLFTIHFPQEAVWCSRRNPDFVVKGDPN